MAKGDQLWQTGMTSRVLMLTWGGTLPNPAVAPVMRMVLFIPVADQMRIVVG